MWWLGIGCGALAAALGCTSPRAHWFVLEDDVTEPSPPAARSPIVLIRGVSLPPEVDRPQIVVRGSRNQVVINEQERWAAPLRDSLPALIASQLNHRSANVRFATRSGAAASLGAALLTIDVSRFEVSRETGATVVMRWIYRPSGRKAGLVEGESEGRSRIDEGGFDGLVDALRLAVEQAAAHLAEQLPDDRPAPTSSAGTLP